MLSEAQKAVLSEGKATSSWPVLENIELEHLIYIEDPYKKVK